MTPHRQTHALSSRKRPKESRRVLAGLLLILAATSSCIRTEVVVTGGDGGGTCTDAGCLCPSPTEECGGRCVDLQSDPEHCGACDRACLALEECRDATCECLDGAARCDGELCRDLERDPNHCGECDAGCASGETCFAGECVCRAGLVRCGEECVDTASNAEHCGGCDHRCAGDPAGEYCWDSACSAVACEQQSPGAEECGATERDCLAPASLGWNPLHCGECDVACAVEEVCTQGVCEAWFAPATCAACPCTECGLTLCCSYPGTSSPICVVGAASCPLTP